MLYLGFSVSGFKSAIVHGLCQRARASVDERVDTASVGPRLCFLRLLRDKIQI